MKFTSIIYLVSVSLCAGFCCSEPEENLTPTITIENNLLISIEGNQTEYALGDAIFINTTINNQQEDINGELVTISDYDYGEVNQSRLIYRLSLYKLTGFGTLVKIPLLGEHLEVLEGDAELDANNENADINVYCMYNGEDYKNKISIELLEAGSYFIGASYRNNENFNYIRGGDYNTSWISIQSKIQDSNADGFFEFTVN